MDSWNLVPYELAAPDAHGDEAGPDTHLHAHPAPQLASDDDIAREPPPASVGQDERRMQVRAYNYWASLLGDRPLPKIEDVTCAALPDFADHAVVLDFSHGVANPAVRMLGKKLAEECGAATSIAQLSDVPGGSLLSRITDHYMQILASEAPIGFEAEFVNQRGTTLLYRGILLPFSGDGENIAHIMGVINWKEFADPIVTAGLRKELEITVEAAHTAVSGPQLPTWADGPIASGSDEPDADPGARGLAGRLADAREAAEAASALEQRSRAALYEAIGRAWDLAFAAQAEPLALREIVGAAGPAVASHDVMATVIKLVFGANYNRPQLAEFALVLAHARRLGLAQGAVAELVARTPGGLKHVGQEERRLRRRSSASKLQNV